ncbi:MAG: major facilitator superfamily protein [Hyphomicrobiales bacterium]|jgi:MFS family permease|nr:major facilitator superfamily protein [Hyphomicrobiales bacterium]
MRPKVPSLIKRNVALFSLSQSFTGAGMQFSYGFGPLMVVSLTGSSALAGLSVGLVGLSRFLVAYPMGRITDTYGRKPGIFLGLTLALLGALTLGFAMLAGSIALFVAGLLTFGMGMNGANQMRVGVADMFPASMRAEALGYLALGSLFGLLLSPVMVALADVIARRTGADPLGLPWFFLPVLIVGGMIIVGFVRPDPKVIGMNLRDYWPGLPVAAASSRAAKPAQFSAMRLLADPSIRLAILSNCAATGNMSIVMVLTSLVLHHHGHSLFVIAVSHTFHAIGMFAFTIPLGKLADRIGRSRVMFPGVFVSLVGAALVAFTPGIVTVTLGTFLVGIGWAAANVAATAYIADQVETHERGRAIGLNDSFAGGSTVFSAFVTGPLIELYGLPATGLTAIFLAIVPFVLRAVSGPMR